MGGEKDRGPPNTITPEGKGEVCALSVKEMDWFFRPAEGWG